MAALARSSVPLGSLRRLAPCRLTPHIGTSFQSSSVQLSSLLTSARVDEYLKDLATLVSQRGVVFFSNQDMNIQQQKLLATRMGELSGKPKSSTLHRHPISDSSAELGADVSVISATGGVARGGVELDRRASSQWHTDISFENVPADYSILKMHTVPEVGGDTLWACGYEAYDRLSPAFAKFLEGLSALHEAHFFVEQAKQAGIPIQDPRGSPENTGSNLRAVHPVIRTNPVTGFKALYINQFFTTRILGLARDESDDILRYLFRHISENHDLQVRYKWNKNDVAIWDNRSALHSATHDYDPVQPREGNRVVSIGEKPFFSPYSSSRRAALGRL